MVVDGAQQARSGAAAPGVVELVGRTSGDATNMDGAPGEGLKGSAPVDVSTTIGISKVSVAKANASIAVGFKVYAKPDGYFAPYALTWSLFGPASANAANCMNLQKRMKQESTSSAATGTHLESRPVMRRWAVEGGRKEASCLAQGGGER